MAAKKHITTDHSAPASKRVELATAAVWEISTLCDEMLEHVAKIDGLKEPHHPKCIIKLLLSRAHELAEVAALCLNEDEASQPFAQLERTVSLGDR
jgi:hypothetical protein